MYLWITIGITSMGGAQTKACHQMNGVRHVLNPIFILGIDSSTISLQRSMYPSCSDSDHMGCLKVGG